MSVSLRPIPPFYAVYILRSTISQASLYIGSTPNPPRRLKQHNGEVQGGARRTSRSKLRPWEMIGLVSGFPSMVAALKFEWAINNPHVSLHIPHESRISFGVRRRRGGRPKRPVKSLKSIAANLHLLLRMPSFARWPLAVHFFDAQFHTRWGEQVNASVDQPRPSICVYTDFGPPSSSSSSSSSMSLPPSSGSKERPWGIYALPLDYSPLEEYVRKTHILEAFEQQGNCVVCREELAPERGLYATCPNAACHSTGHVSCWSQHLLKQNKSEDDQIIPVEGHCPECRGEVNWGVMMKELSLRTRGTKEVDKLLNKRSRKRPTRAESAGEQNDE
ncbi:GIY-YIG catalytic domain-containing protein [Camillea tinctor]|nr:GIY-YIG catalytic domain-containing protein [Camillea tinctor]